MKLLKKTISATLALAMVTTSLLSVAAVDNTQQKAKYSAFKTSYINEQGERVSKIDYSTEPLHNSKARTNLPESYNSADYGYVTPVKNQGGTSTCWAHAAIAACESSMIINNGYDTSLDLSELHLAYARFHNNVDKMGMFDGSAEYKGEKTYIRQGNDVISTLITLANQQGVVKESANHGQFSSNKLLLRKSENFQVYNPESLYAYNEAYVTNSYIISTLNPELLKEYIIKYGSGVMSMNVDFYNNETSTYYCCDENTSKVGMSHAVALVGWDDNYPKENCTVDGHTPENDGAWLIKNSWGEDEGINGYMWVSYEDKTIRDGVFYELSQSGTHTNTYQYDDACDESFLIDKNFKYNFEGGAYMANMFTAQKDNETLEAVSFYTSNENLDYTVNVYTGVEGITDPTNGTLKATISGEDLLMGYHTIELPEPVALNKGEKFSVVINIKDNQDPSRGVYVNVDNEYDTDISVVKVTEYGESFFSLNGESWDDIKYFFNGNMRIKAFTDSDETPMELTDYYDSYNGKTREELLAELKATVDKYQEVINGSYRYSFESIEKLRNVYYYACDVCDKPDIFLSVELFELNKKINNLYEKLEPFNIEEFISYYYDYIHNLPYYDTVPLWKNFENIYNSVVEESKTITLDWKKAEEYKNTVKQAFIEYMTYAINYGLCVSGLQNYGDADNNGYINIKDATTIQMFVSELTDYDLNKYYNSDVDADADINIKDATIVQEYVAKLIDYMPVYDKKIGQVEANKNIDLDTAVENLKKMVENIENAPYYIYLEEDPFCNRNINYLILLCQYNDAKKVLENPENYLPIIIDFKARHINSTMFLIE